MNTLTIFSDIKNCLKILVYKKNRLTNCLSEHTGSDVWHYVVAERTHWCMINKAFRTRAGANAEAELSVHDSIGEHIALINTLFNYSQFYRRTKANK